MKILIRTLLGLFSSLLLTAGLAKAAECFDPLSQPLVFSHDDQSLLPECPAEGCTFPCALDLSTPPAPLS